MPEVYCVPDDIVVYFLCQERNLQGISIVTKMEILSFALFISAILFPSLNSFFKKSFPVRFSKSTIWESTIWEDKYETKGVWMGRQETEVATWECQESSRIFGIFCNYIYHYHKFSYFLKHCHVSNLSKIPISYGSWIYRLD